MRGPYIQHGGRPLLQHDLFYPVALSRTPPCRNICFHQCRPSHTFCRFDLSSCLVIDSPVGLLKLFRDFVKGHSCMAHACLLLDHLHVSFGVCSCFVVSLARSDLLSTVFMASQWPC